MAEWTEQENLRQEEEQSRDAYVKRVRDAYLTEQERQHSQKCDDLGIPIMSRARIFRVA